ncbi:MAG: hypothetical protein ACRDL9_18300, partial [Trebonia sp.]
EYSTYRWLLEPLLTAAGFEIIEVSFERRLYGAYTCVKRYGPLSTAGHTRGSRATALRSAGSP